MAKQAIRLAHELPAGSTEIHPTHADIVAPNARLVNVGVHLRIF
jgi:hypothetical protein